MTTSRTSASHSRNNFNISLQKTVPTWGRFFLVILFFYEDVKKSLLGNNGIVAYTSNIGIWFYTT